MGIRIRPATTLSVLLLIVLGLQILAIISVPITKSIALCTYDGYKFGVFGLCNGSECSSISIGYISKELSDSLSGFSLPSKARRSVSKLLIVHVISAGFSFILFLNSIILHWSGPSKSLRFLLINLLWSMPTFLLSLLSFLVDILLFVPHLDWGGWIVLAATVLIAVCSVLLCIMRRTVSSRRGHKNYGGKNGINDGLAYQLAPLSYGYGTVDGGSYVTKQKDHDDYDEADDTFDGQGYQSRYTDISQIPQTTRYDHVRDGSVVSSSHGGYMSRESPYMHNNALGMAQNPLLNQADEEDDFYTAVDVHQTHENILTPVQPTYRPEDLDYINPEPIQNQEAEIDPAHHPYEPAAPPDPLATINNKNQLYESRATIPPYPTTEPDSSSYMIGEKKDSIAPYPTTDPVPEPSSELLDFQSIPQLDQEADGTEQPQHPGSPGRVLGPRPYMGSSTSLNELDDTTSSTKQVDLSSLGFEPPSKVDVTVGRNPTFRTKIEQSLNALQPEDNILEEEEEEEEEEGKANEDASEIDFVKKRSEGVRIGRNIDALSESDFDSSVISQSEYTGVENSQIGSSTYDGRHMYDEDRDELYASQSRTNGEDDITSEYSRVPSVSSLAYSTTKPLNFGAIPPSQISSLQDSQANFNKNSYTSRGSQSRNEPPATTPQQKYFASPNPGPSQFIMTPTPPTSQAAQSMIQRTPQSSIRHQIALSSYHNPQPIQPTPADIQDLTEYKTQGSEAMQLPDPEDQRSTPPPSFTGQSFTSSHYTSVSQRGVNPEYMKLHPEEFGLMRTQSEEQRLREQQQQQQFQTHQQQQRTQGHDNAAGGREELRPQGNMGRFDVKRTGLMVPPKLGNAAGGGKNVIDYNPDFSVDGEGKGKN